MGEKFILCLVGVGYGLVHMKDLPAPFAAPQEQGETETHIIEDAVGRILLRHQLAHYKVNVVGHAGGLVPLVPDCKHTVPLGALALHGSAELLQIAADLVGAGADHADPGVHHIAQNIVSPLHKIAAPQKAAKIFGTFGKVYEKPTFPTGF